MAIISEKHIFEIYKRLGEPEFFAGVRKDALSQLQKNKEKCIKYGLGINFDGSKFFSGSKKGDPKYKNTVESGAIVYDWVDGVRKYKNDIIDGFEKSQESLIKNIIAANATASFSGGKVIVCPGDTVANVVLDTDLCGASDIIFVMAQPGSNMTIFDTVASSGSAGSRIVIVIAKYDTSVKYIQTHEGKESVYNNVAFFAGKKAYVSYTGVSLSSGQDIKTDMSHYLDGEGSSCKTQNISISYGNGVVDLESNIYHRASHTESKVLACGVASDKSKTIYRSDIQMQKDTQGIVVGDQKASFLILSPKAEVDAIPALNIAQKEVQCSHSVSVSHIKDSDLYYPRLRGLEKDEASEMIIDGMLQSGLQDLREDFVSVLQDKIQKTLKK